VQVVTITHKDTTQNGKDRVYFDGKNDWKDAYYIKQGLYAPSVGSMVEVETHAWTPPGKNVAVWYLDSWKAAPASAAVGASQRPQAPTPSPARGNGQSAPVEAHAQPLKGWDIQSGDLSRYASNIVASAITAGLIKQPHQIVGWAAAAYTSGNSLREGLFVRKLPSQMADFGDPNENQDRDPDEGRDYSDKDLPF
jgi:hypothetical protein